MPTYCVRGHCFYENYDNIETYQKRCLAALRHRVDDILQK